VQPFRRFSLEGLFLWQKPAEKRPIAAERGDAGKRNDGLSLHKNFLIGKPMRRKGVMKLFRLSSIASFGTLLVLGLMFTCSPLYGYDINDQFSVSGVMSGAYQYQWVSDSDVHDLGRGAFSFQSEVSFRPTDGNEFFTKIGFGAGNGLNDKSPFVLAPWAASLEDDVKDINGRDRDYLLTAWFKHGFQFNESTGLSLTGGIIDATDYLDENAYANDEYTQFMNEALVNGPNGFAPSFDLGGAAQFFMGDFSANAVVMDVGENDDGNNYHFFGLQAAYRLDTALGEGNYRLMVHATSKQFLDKKGKDKERLACAMLSFDQQLGDIFGVWIRLGREDDKAAVDYQNHWSGGVNISGTLWGREDDNIGIGYDYMNGGNLDLDSSQVLEAYVRIALAEYFALTLDGQYMQDKYDHADDPKGFIGGIRMTADF
jgi:porin